MTITDPTRTDEPNALGTHAITEGVEPVLIPADRYRTQEFADLEAERLWPTAWVLACTAQHVPEPGDFYEYRCGPISVLIVRNDDGGLRAFQNVCRHRGNSICQGMGSGLSELRCPYHRWSWDLDGTLVEVPSRKGFGSGFKNDDFGLIQVQVDSWGPLVFINLDTNAVPLAEYLEGIPADAAWANIDEFHCRAAVTVPVNSNWKVVAEGFSETYHVQGIHHELLGAIDDVHAPQILWGLHGASYQAYGVPSPRLGQNVSDQQVWDAFIDTQGARMGVPERAPVPEIPDGRTVRDVIADLIRAEQAKVGVDLSGYTTPQVTDLAQYNLFPNISVLISADMMSVLMGRPGESPHDAFFTMFSFVRGGDAPRVAEYVVPDDTEMGMVMGQDLSILRTAQVGLRQPGFTHLAVGAEEPRIINLHRNLTRWLGLPDDELRPI